MDVTTDHELHLLVGPSHSLKRKASGLEAKYPKKARSDQRAADAGFDGTEYRGSQVSSDEYGDDQMGITISTPLTPISSQASPRFPCDLKTHHCPYPDCEKSFNRPAKLDQHLRSHTNTRPFMCTYAPCTKNFLRSSHLKHHVKTAHSNIRDYVCNWEGCEKSFTTAQRLKRHQAAHEGKEKFRCTIAGCSHTFRKHGTLQKHIITIHEGGQPFVCKEFDGGGQNCGAGFHSEGKLKAHVVRVHGTKIFVCGVCSVEREGYDQGEVQGEAETCFSTYATLQTHIINEHPPECPQCGLQCTSQSAVKSHLEVIHGSRDVEERQVHICPEENCGQGFTKKGNLNAHVQIIHRGKRFVCGEVDPMTLIDVGNWDGGDACGEPATSKRNLERHIRKVHLGWEEPSGKSKRKPKNPPTTTTRSSPSKDATSVLMRLTGVGYDTESGRNILCLVQGCTHRFLRQYDLEIHLQSRHGLADLEIQGMLMERDSCFQSDSQVSQSTAAVQGFGASLGPETLYKGSDDVGEFDEFNAERTFTAMDSWLGGHSYTSETDGDNMEQKEMTMQRLDGQHYGIDGTGGVQGEDVDMIDPDLF